MENWLNNVQLEKNVTLLCAYLPTVKLQACLHKPNWIRKCCCCKTWTKSKHKI